MPLNQSPFIQISDEIPENPFGEEDLPLLFNLEDVTPKIQETPCFDSAVSFMSSTKKVEFLNVEDEDESCDSYSDMHYTYDEESKDTMSISKSIYI